LNKAESLAIRGSDFVLPVCQNLAEKVTNYVPENRMCILHDIPLKFDNYSSEVEDLRNSLKIDGCFALYVGNLEHYQGIDLMIEGMANIPAENQLNLVVIGGINSHIKKYNSMAKRMGLSGKVHFLGPRPLRALSLYLNQADILVSPRAKGENTPMKIYSYLASGKPVLATRIKSHTQVMDSSCAMLVDPTPDSIAKGFTALIRDPYLRLRLGKAGKDLVEKKYSEEVYRRKLLDCYARVTEVT
jgi:glycosyltransferase involved in cell wall biosynthesis